MKLQNVAIMAVPMSLAWTAAAVSAEPDATKWLSLVDAGHYAQSWAGAGVLFKSHITAADLESKVKPVRAPLGAVISRSPGAEKEMSQLPGAPDGDYKIVTFNTRFANKAAAVETVVLARESAGWKVDGYFIK
jgi:hypothetical protein